MSITALFAAFRRLVGKHQTVLITLFFGVLLPLIAFGKLAENVWSEGGFAWDTPGLRLVHHYATPGRDTFVAFVTILGGQLALPLMALIVLALRYIRQPAGAVFFVLAVGGAYGLNLVTKAFFRRVRPQLWQSPAPEFDYSFPSGHAMLSMAVFLVFVLPAWPTRLRWPALILGIPCVLAVGISRLYLGVHYPSDIIAGWSAALLWVIGVHLILFPQSGRKGHEADTGGGKTRHG